MSLAVPHMQASCSEPFSSIEKDLAPPDYHASASAGSGVASRRSKNARAGAGAPLTDTCVVPWKQVFALGSGVDALTGACMRQAVTEITETTTKSGDINQYIHLCCDSESVRRTFSRTTTAQLAINFEPLDLRAGLTTRSLGHIEYSSTSFSLVVRWIYMDSILHSTRQTYALKDNARDLLVSDRDAFLERYGHYFIASCNRGSQFDAVLTFKCQDAEKRQLAMTSLQAAAGITSQSFHTTGKAELERDLGHLNETSKHCTSISLRIEMEGVDTKTRQQEQQEQPLQQSAEVTKASQPPLIVADIKSELGRVGGAHPVLARLEWFQNHRSPSLISAELRPYYLIEDLAVESLPRTLPVSASAFIEIEKIRVHFLNCITATTALSNVIDGTQLKKRLDEFKAGCERYQSELPSDDTRRKDMLLTAEALDTQCAHFCAAWDLWRTLRACETYEGHQKATEAVSQWVFGHHECMTDPLRVYKRTFKPVAVRGFLGRDKRTLRVADLEPPSKDKTTGSPASKADDGEGGSELSPAARIVGWSITSGSANGMWRSVRPRNGLLSPLTAGDGHPEPLLSVTSGKRFWNGDEWTIIVYLLADKYLDIIAKRFPA